ncbi:MAG: ATP-binding protein, partial [Bacteroidota bacterium]|nr:ATP-binding protein [Bacteroidota bacterium]
PTDRIELPYDENFLSFEFVVLNYDAPEKNQYAYKLEGLDKDWIYSGTRRFASYTNLDPGAYTFRVKASNNDGIWNEQGAYLHLAILPPWWQTWWAYSLYGFMGICFLYVLRQYTVNRERMKHELKIQRLEAEKMHEIDHLKSRFFANISHEFRTPLTLILGPLEKITSSHTEEKPDKSVYHMMLRNARRLLHLINQLLDLSKLEAGSMKLEEKPADLVAFLKAMVFSFTSLAEMKQIQYHFQFPSEHPVVYFDADKLEKIITNLLSNAFKFTPEGGEVAVIIKLQPADKQALSTFPADLIQRGISSKANILELIVQDSGKGIPQDQIDKVFDRFYQADTSHTREQEGTGIGLSLVKELVELFSGEIAVESQPGQGSCFTVRLPLLVANFKQVTLTGNNLPPIPINHNLNSPENGFTVAPYPEIENPDPEAPLILIIEDNADVRFFIRENLQPVYQVIEAADGKEGYKLAVKNIPDLILSDVMMPKMDGVELCSKLKTNEKTAHIPVILLTAKASGGDKVEGLETGADDYLIKPFESTELLVRIKNLIDSRRKLREIFSREITLGPTSITINSVDEQFLQRIMKIIEEHMEDTSFDVEIFSREAGLSKIQLHRKLKALTNESPGDFIRIMRLKRAADLLSQNAGTIAEVAYKVGFQEPSYFTRCFHKQFGKTPSEFMAACNVGN